MPSIMPENLGIEFLPPADLADSTPAPSPSRSNTRPNTKPDDAVEQFITATAGIQREDLWEEYKSSFGYWNIDDFKNLSPRLMRNLRMHLYKQGIPVSVKRGRDIHLQLFKLLIEWPLSSTTQSSDQYSTSSLQSSMPTKVLEANLKRQPLEHARIENWLPAPIDNGEPTATIPNWHAAPIMPTMSVPRRPIHFPTNDRSTTIPRMQSAANDANDNPDTAEMSKNDAPIQFRPQNSQSIIPTMQTLPDPSSYASFAKAYDDNLKYKGPQDSLDFCLLPFQEKCRIWGIPKAYGFSVMLKGQASRYYFQSISGKNWNFDQMVTAIKTKFETEEWRERALHNWSTLDLTLIRRKYPHKSTIWCFEVLQLSLANLQLKLRQELRSDSILRDKVLLACRDYPECNFARFKRAETFQQACEDIRTALRIREELENGE